MRITLTLADISKSTSQYQVIIMIYNGYPVLQQQQHAVVRQQFDFLFKALHASRFVGEGDLSEAGAVEICCVVHPGLSQHRLGSVFSEIIQTEGKKT